MPLDKAAYKDLEKQFKTQVKQDRPDLIDWVKQRSGVYLPCKEPENQVDYIIVGMEPSFGWADSNEDAEKKIACGFRNFAWPKNRNARLALFMRSIEKFLCQSGETYHLTDVAKGAMPVTVAALDRDRRYKKWYPLLLDEIEIVGKPGAPVIAIGQKVEMVLQRGGLKGRSLYTVPHYSSQAAASLKREADMEDPKGFEEFKKAEFDEGSRWPAGLSLAGKQLVFAYKKRFKEIRA